MSVRITFPGTGFDPVELAEGVFLSEALDAVRSPLLFGCRTGICGTCLVEVVPEDDLPPPDADEQELLDVLAPDNPHARLACQLRATIPMAIVPLPEAG